MNYHENESIHGREATAGKPQNENSTLPSGQTSKGAKKRKPGSANNAELSWFKAIRFRGDWPATNSTPDRAAVHFLQFDREHVEGGTAAGSVEEIAKCAGKSVDELVGNRRSRRDRRRRMVP